MVDLLVIYEYYFHFNTMRQNNIDQVDRPLITCTYSIKNPLMISLIQNLVILQCEVFQFLILLYPFDLN